MKKLSDAEKGGKEKRPNELRRDEKSSDDWRRRDESNCDQLRSETR